MEISKELISILNKYVDVSNTNGYEFELIVRDQLDGDMFQSLLNVFQKNPDYSLKQDISRESLDIRTVNDEYSDIRTTITGKQKVLEYCQSNKMNKLDKSVSYLRKTRLSEYPPIELSEYNVRANLKLEEIIENNDEILHTYQDQYLVNAKKNFRYKQRYTFLHDTHKIDMSVIKASTGEEKQFKQMLKKSKTVYEFEIELLPVESKQTNKALEDMLNCVTVALKTIHNTQHLITNNKKEELLHEYVDLLMTKESKQRFSDKQGLLKYVKMNPYKHYLRYQPSTLVKSHLVEPVNINSISIMNDYSVTEKADGERFLLFIGKDKHVYFIDNKLQFIKLSETPTELSGCLIDGEYVRKGKLMEDLQLYLGFDMYFHQSKDIRLLNLKERLDSLKEVFDKINKNTPISIDLQVKKFYFDLNNGKDTILTYSNQILKNLHTFPYRTDGLVFTPINISAGGLYKNDKTANEFGGSWPVALKWKPSEENSIDALIRIGDQQVLINNNGKDLPCNYVELYVAYSGFMEDTVNIFDIYESIEKQRHVHNQKTNKKHTVKRLYDYTLIPASLMVTEQTSENIHDDTIVEFRFNPESITNTDNFQKWIPIKVRHDKTRLYKTTNKIDNTANSFVTAQNVWLSIREPVTKEMISGLTSIDSSEVFTNTQELYYARETPRHRSMLKPMLDFHNMWVKKKSMYDKYGKPKQKLLEIGCGQAGDIQKWIDKQFSVVVGIDNNTDNLINNDHGAYRRMQDSVFTDKDKTRLNVTKQSFLFLLLDGGKLWTDEYLNSVEDEEFKRLTAIAAGKTNVKKSSLSKFYNVLNKGFELISCQFAIHYFFENKKTLDAFCQNVNNHLNKNGLFIGTTFDGRSVDSAFRSKNTDKLQGVLNDKILWQIQKNYENFVSDSISDENLGKQIDVYIETINKIIPEYLVDFQLLVRKFESYGIKLVESGSFEELFVSLQQASANGFKHYALQSILEGMQEKVLREYSFLNRWFVFQKT